MISLGDTRGAGQLGPNRDASHLAGTPGRNDRPRKKPRRSDPTSSPPSLSGLPQKSFQAQSLNRAKTPYPGLRRKLKTSPSGVRSREVGFHENALSCPWMDEGVM